MGIEPDSSLAEYVRLLGGWPGLIGRGEDPAALVEDALVLLPHLGGAATLVDVGSGGGMPGIPLALARPELQVTLIEADARKASFLEHAGASLGLDLRVLNERAEPAAQPRPGGVGAQGRGHAARLSPSARGSGPPPTGYISCSRAGTLAAGHPGRGRRRAPLPPLHGHRPPPFRGGDAGVPGGV